MADLGFLPGVTRILAATPAGGQRLLFSATLDNGVDKLVNRFLQQPGRALGRRDRRSSPAAMTHHVFHVSGVGAEDASSCTGSPRAPVAESCSCAPSIRRASWPSSSPTPVCRRWICTATCRSPPATATSPPSLRRRRACLVATDIAARGVHVDDVELVVHVDPPIEHKAYLHRSGRTARAGSAGDVVTVVLPEQRRDTQQLLRKAGITVRRSRSAPIRPACSSSSATSHWSASRRRPAAYAVAPAPKVAAQAAATNRRGPSRRSRRRVIGVAALLAAPGRRQLRRRRQPAAGAAALAIATVRRRTDSSRRRRRSAADGRAPAVWRRRTSRPHQHVGAGAPASQ